METRLVSCALHLSQLLLEADSGQREKIFRELRTLDLALCHQLLPTLERELVRALRRRSALLEYAGSIAPSTVGELEESFSKKMGFPVHFTLRENPALIGGLRVTCGDRRWEHSLRAMLSQFLAGSMPLPTNDLVAA